MVHLKIYLSYIATFFLITVTAQDINHEMRKYLKDYNKNRTELVEKEQQLCVGGNMKLDEVEKHANHIFRQYKLDDLQYTDIAGEHFYYVKDKLQNSMLYQLIRKMPKGANLNIHALGSVSSDWIVNELSNMEGFLICKDAKTNKPLFTFRKKVKTNYLDCKNIKQYTKGKSIDKVLKPLVDLLSSRNSPKILPNDKMFELFSAMFDRIEDAIYYEPAYKAFHRQMLEEMYEDKIMYAEIRTQFFELYDNTKKIYRPEETVKTLKKIVEDFKKEHKNFIGVKFIFAVLRHGSEEELRKNIKQYERLVAQFPDDIIGLDIVGWEDYGLPLKKFVKDFFEINIDYANFFFQAGETNMLGDSSDYNLFEAFTLLTRRIGMGYALWKHPHILKEVISSKTPIEICPVSNQITSFVRDLRNHPGGYYLAKNATVVIGSDSPGFFGTTGLSTDLYYTVLSLASSKADLRMLKELILNSINYSDMEELEKIKALRIFNRQWYRFLYRVIKDYHIKRKQHRTKRVATSMYV